MKTRQIALGDKINVIQQLTDTGWKTLGLIEDGVNLELEGTCDIEFCNFRKDEEQNDCVILLQDVTARDSTFRGDCLVFGQSESLQIHRSLIRNSTIISERGSLINSEILETDVKLKKIWANESLILQCSLTGKSLSSSHSNLTLHRGELEYLALEQENLIIKGRGVLPRFSYHSSSPSLVMLEAKDIMEGDHIFAFDVLDSGVLKTVQVFQSVDKKIRLVRIRQERHESPGELNQLNLNYHLRGQIIEQWVRLRP